MSAPPARALRLEAVHLLEDVRRQTLDAIEIRHSVFVPEGAKRQV